MGGWEDGSWSAGLSWISRSQMGMLLMIDNLNTKGDEGRYHEEEGW